MIMRTRSHLGLLFIAACFIFATPALGRADNLLRLFLEGQVNELYGDNIGLRSNNEIGDFGTTLVGGFYLDLTSEARYASLHYDTFAQLYLHRSQFDRAGEGQFVNATDTENISPTTKLRFEDFFYRDAPTEVAVATSDQAPQFNNILATLLLANDQATVNHFGAIIYHAWGHKWSSELGVHQTTFWGQGNSQKSGNGSSSYVQSVNTNTIYHFTEKFALGAGYRFYDFRFTFPGRPGAQAHWPYARAIWEPVRDLYLAGNMGVAIAHTQGASNTTVNPAGIAEIEYSFRRGHVSVYGGQEPTLTSALGGVGEIRGGRGNVLYYFTRRLTGSAGAGGYQTFGGGFNGQLVSWGVGLTERVNQSVSVYARFVQLRVTETAPNQFLLPSGIHSGQEAVGNYFVIGMSASIEAFRWSWQ
jgi:hypothetical protein